MIQRIQTLFIFGVFAAYAACFFLPFWDYISPDSIYRLSLFAVSCIKGVPKDLDIGTFPIIVLVSASALLSAISMFYYKKRQLQIKINNYNMLLTVIFTGTIYLGLPFMIKEKLLTATQQWQPGLILPLLALVFLILANTFIKKDEKLVKRADRIR